MRLQAQLLSALGGTQRPCSPRIERWSCETDSHSLRRFGRRRTNIRPLNAMRTAPRLGSWLRLPDRGTWSPPRRRSPSPSSTIIVLLRAKLRLLPLLTSVVALLGGHLRPWLLRTQLDWRCRGGLIGPSIACVWSRIGIGIGVVLLQSVVRIASACSHRISASKAVRRPQAGSALAKEKQQPSFELGSAQI